MFKLVTTTSPLNRPSLAKAFERCIDRNFVAVGGNIGVVVILIGKAIATNRGLTCAISAGTSARILLRNPGQESTET